MTCILEVTPEERTAFAYLLLAEAGRLRKGTREHQEIGAGLQSVYDGFIAAPEGPVEVETLNDEMYMLGVRNYVDASELEEYWLDNQLSVRQNDEIVPFPDPEIGQAIQTYFPEAVSAPLEWSYDDVRPIFSELGFKIDRSVTEGAPRVRGLYNRERAEIIRRTRLMQESRAAARGRVYERAVPLEEAWRRVMRTEQLASGEMTEVKVDGTKIVLTNVDGEVCAVQGGCTHARELAAISGLADGSFDPFTACITCPWHGARFDVRTGKVMRQPYSADFKRGHFFKGSVMSLLDFRRKARDLKTYKTKVEDGFVWVNVV